MSNGLDNQSIEILKAICWGLSLFSAFSAAICWKLLGKATMALTSISEINQDIVVIKEDICSIYDLLNRMDAVISHFGNVPESPKHNKIKAVLKEQQGNISSIKTKVYDLFNELQSIDSE